MSSHKIYGHEALRDRLGGAIASGRFPQTALFLGPRGSGRQTLTLWCAAGLLCDEPSAKGGCGQCRSCDQVAGLVHPDLHWFIPVTVKKRASDPSKQIDDLEDVLADVLAERRADRLYPPPEAGASHSLASVRLIHRKLSRKPFQGMRKVLLVGDAERLIVQEASQEAANALLKVLEEPPADTVVILTAESAQALLPTIRSRVVPVRVRPVSRDAVVAFVENVMGQSGKKAQATADRALGNIGTIVAARTTSASQDADGFLASVKKGPTGWMEAALKQPPWGARTGFSDLLDSLETRMEAEIRRRAETDSGDLSRALRALRIVESHREFASRNVNPQLALAVMTREFGELR